MFKVEQTFSEAQTKLEGLLAEENRLTLRNKDVLELKTRFAAIDDQMTPAAWQYLRCRIRLQVEQMQVMRTYTQTPYSTLTACCGQATVTNCLKMQAVPYESPQ